MLTGDGTRETPFDPDHAEHVSKKVAERELRMQPGDPRSLEQRPEASENGQKPQVAVVWACFWLGAVCVVSSVLRSWLAEPTSFDWLILAMGVTLAGLSLFQSVSVGPEGFKAEMKKFRAQMARMIGDRS